MAFTVPISLMCCFVICLRIKTVQANCYNTGNFTANGTYSKNRETIIASLASNAAANGGFYNFSVGNGSDTVYATALCRGDASPTQCSSCVNTTAYNLISECPVQYEALSWAGDPLCVVHYANVCIFGVLEMSPSLTVFNTGTISWKTSGFYKTWAGLVEKLKSQATAESSRLKYAAGKENFTLTQYIYAMVQCTPDLSKSDCEHCLTQSIADYESLSSGHRGGGVNRPNCLFRWDLYLFYNEVDSAPPSPCQYAPPSPPTDNGGLSAKTIAIIVGSAVISIAFIVVGLILFCLKRRRRITTVELVKIDDAVASSSECLHLDFGTIRAATDDFSDNKKLAQGGFGTVYKGILPNGQQIAVKRLDRGSLLGRHKFKNEVNLLSKLRHRNVVRLVGFSMEKEERVLVYEFLPNLSLNYYIFDKNKRYLLDWTRRYQIISGIAKALLYLHEESQLRVIHRDLRLSNILLDEEMNAKIAGFEAARLFAYDRTHDTTSKIVGISWFMAPEYVMYGHFSVKSDVFSFGGLTLEIVSGQQIRQIGNDVNLVTNAWRNWNEGNALNFIDPILRSGSIRKMLRCIHIGLLCVQENAADRPTTAEVVVMLSSESISLALPSKPAYFIDNFSDNEVNVTGTNS